MIVTGERPAIDLDEEGVAEDAWYRLAAGLPAWRPAAPAGRRVVVVAPHPDDETLGAGGTVATLAAAGAPVLFVSATDGEAAPSPWSAAELAALRRRELSAAAATLAPAATVARLGLPDGRLGERAGELCDALGALLNPDDLVLATLAGDGHPDHDATGAAARLAAMLRGAELWWYPVWAWHWHDPARTPIAGGRRVDLDPAARRAKSAAAAAYASQLGGDHPVVPPSHVRRCLRPFEVLIAP